MSFVGPFHDRFVTDYPTGQGEGGQSQRPERPCLVCERLFLASRRRCLAARLGFVGRRLRGGGAAASVSSTAIRSRAALRLASWVRCSEAATVTTPSTSRLSRRASIRARTVSGNDGERATS